MSSFQLELIRSRTSSNITYQHIRIHISSEDRLIKPEDLRKVKLPEIRSDIGVVIEGRGPNWLYCFLVLQYQEAAWLGCYDPRFTGAVVIASNIRDVFIGQVQGLHLTGLQAPKSLEFSQNLAPAAYASVREEFPIVLTEYWADDVGEYQVIQVGALRELNNSQPNILQALELPQDLSFSKGIIFQGRALMWLYCYLVIQCELAKWIGTYSSSSNNFVVVASRDRNIPIGKTFETKKAQSIRIFLAYSREDKHVALELYDRLKQQGYQPWSIVRTEKREK